MYDLDLHLYINQVVRFSPLWLDCKNLSKSDSHDKHFLQPIEFKITILEMEFPECFFCPAPTTHFYHPSCLTRLSPSGDSSNGF